LRTKNSYLLYRPGPFNCSFKPQLSEYKHWYLGFGLVTAWVAGVGRYWDNPRADLWQYLGLGSVVYCLFMSGVIFLLLWPLKPRNWTYQNVLIFVSMTSLPAWLYAIPVERFTPLDVAQVINMWFLAIVATWRVALLCVYLNRAAGMSGFKIAVAALLPVVIVVNVLSALNLEHVVFHIMAGIAEEDRSANDLAYTVVFLISILSLMLLPLLLMCYGWYVYQAHKKQRPLA